MATRKVREIGDPVLEKKCKEVTEMTPRLQEIGRASCRERVSS